MTKASKRDLKRLESIALEKGFHKEGVEDGWLWDTWVKDNGDKTWTVIGYGDNAWNVSTECVDFDNPTECGEIDEFEYDTLDEMLSALGWSSYSKEDEERIYRVHMGVYDCERFMGNCYEWVIAGKLDPEAGVRHVKEWAETARRKLKAIAPKRFAEDREVLLERINEYEEMLCGYIESRVKAV